MDSFRDIFRQDVPESELDKAFRESMEAPAASPLEAMRAAMQMPRDKPLKPRTAMISTDFCDTCLSAWRISDKLENCPVDGTLLRRRLVEVLV